MGTVPFIVCFALLQFFFNFGPNTTTYVSFPPSCYSLLRLTLPLITVLSRRGLSNEIQGIRPWTERGFRKSRGHNIRPRFQHPFEESRYTHGVVEYV